MSEGVSGSAVAETKPQTGGLQWKLIVSQAWRLESEIQVG